MASLTFIIFIFSFLLTTTTQETPQQLQFNSIIDSIVGAGDFTNWANLLSQADSSFFPLAATFFIPDASGQNLSSSSPSPSTSSSSSTVNFLDPLLFPYHIVPRRFDFIDLLQFPTGARLPTLLPGNTLLITNNSADNFTINGAPITHSDLFQNAVVSAHGVGKVLDYTLYGKDDNDHANDHDLLSDSAFSPESAAELLSTPRVEMSVSGGIMDADMALLVILMCYFALMTIWSPVVAMAFLDVYIILLFINMLI